MCHLNHLNDLYYSCHLNHLNHLNHLHYLNHLNYLYECDLICTLLILYAKKILTVSLICEFNSKRFQWSISIICQLNYVCFICAIIFVRYTFLLFSSNIVNEILVISFKFSGCYVNEIELFFKWF